MRFPEEIARVAEWERIVSEASKRGAASFFTLREKDAVGLTDEEFKKKASIHGRVEWSNTSRGGNQIDLINVTEEPALCHSMYGLCE